MPNQSRKFAALRFRASIDAAASSDSGSSIGIAYSSRASADSDSVTKATTNTSIGSCSCGVTNASRPRCQSTHVASGRAGHAYQSSITKYSPGADSGPRSFSPRKRPKSFAQNHSPSRSGERACSASGQIVSHGRIAMLEASSTSRCWRRRQVANARGSSSAHKPSSPGASSPLAMKPSPAPVPSARPASTGRRALRQSPYSPIAKPASSAVSVIIWCARISRPTQPMSASGATQPCSRP